MQNNSYHKGRRVQDDEYVSDIAQTHDVEWSGDDLELENLEYLETRKKRNCSLPLIAILVVDETAADYTIIYRDLQPHHNTYLLQPLAAATSFQNDHISLT